MTTTAQAAIRLAVVDSDSGFLQVLTKRLDTAGWQHRVLASPVPLDALVAMRLNAVVLDLAVLGPQAWTYLEKLCARLPQLGVVAVRGGVQRNQRQHRNHQRRDTPNRAQIGATPRHGTDYYAIRAGPRALAAAVASRNGR